MTNSHPAAARRLARLERVLEGRRERLASAIDRRRRRLAAERTAGSLQRYGYPVAVALAMTAVLPTVLRFAVKRRKLLTRTATTRLGIGKLRDRLDSGQLWDDGR